MTVSRCQANPRCPRVSHSGQPGEELANRDPGPGVRATAPGVPISGLDGLGQTGAHAQVSFGELGIFTRR